MFLKVQRSQLYMVYLSYSEHECIDLEMQNHLLATVALVLSCLLMGKSGLMPENQGLNQFRNSL